MSGFWKINITEFITADEKDGVKPTLIKGKMIDTPRDAFLFESNYCEISGNGFPKTILEVTSIELTSMRLEQNEVLIYTENPLPENCSDFVASGLFACKISASEGSFQS